MFPQFQDMGKPRRRSAVAGDAPNGYTFRLDAGPTGADAVVAQLVEQLIRNQ